MGLFLLIQKSTRSLFRREKMSKKSVLIAAVVAAVPMFAPVIASADLLLSDDFSTAASSANYNTYVSNTAGSFGPNGAANAAGDITFAYDYSALGIPSAPHTSDSSTLGVRIRADNLANTATGTTVGASILSTKNLSGLGKNFTVSVDVWSNYIGSGTSIATSGSNGTTGVTLGIGSAGTSAQYIAGNDGFLVEGFGDNGGGANNEFRVYTNNTKPLPSDHAAYFPSVNASATNTATANSYTDPYWSFLTSKTAPSVQVTASATQGGSTPVGVLGFAWHTFVLTGDGTNVTWTIDGVPAAVVPFSAFTTAGSQVSIGNVDTGLTGNSTAINQLLNAEIFDNLTVNTTVPEPTTATLAAPFLLLLARRRRA